MTTFDRRTALSLVGSGMLALAGCSETTDDADSGNGDGTDGPDDGTEDDQSTDDADVSLGTELPSYATVLPETDGTGYFYGAIDVETMASLLEGSDAEAGDEPSDPLLGNPILVALYCSHAIGLLGNSPSLEAYRANSETEQADGTQETFVFADGVYAFVGAYDFDGLTADLESVDAYEPETVASEYATYADPETGEVVGVTDEVFAFSAPSGSDSDFDPVTAVKRTVATAAGEREPKHAVDDGFDALLRAGENDGIALGLSTADDEFAAETLESAADDADQLTFAFDAFAGANGLHQHLSVGNGEGNDASARAVATYADAERLDRERLESSSLGTDADSVAVAVVQDGTTAVVDAEYAGDLVDSE
ncbi:hypothetical protein [Halopiger xanaduensis]|uniref:Uncharacterized protein n=1 Tax=Halopiger xanaduensis (strain DSM 18323 / JCM 14033 / SH-6) TaxID=797210 RepID=F8DAD5_HALXS|nr:hypothetical protein [Halopiger xanaduensis]AEH37967.1 hypothetical protein Halxa_3355 [Halopiger xanaduensis SH-6]